MAQFTRLTSRVLPLPIDNVDTDQIIPARFLKVTDKNGLGKVLFCDWRYQGTIPSVEAAEQVLPRPEFVLNQPAYQGAQILLAGDNFGCGSSREHAPWALTAYGFRAVISTSFADIFFNNALKNGLLCVQVDTPTHASLLSLVANSPQAELTIDLESQSFHCRMVVPRPSQLTRSPKSACSRESIS
jgi:3-isopropylmalate/(R)-2-methylmalate dehydratase small subunit